MRRGKGCKSDAAKIDFCIVPIIAQGEFWRDKIKGACLNFLGKWGILVYLIGAFLAI